MNAERPGPSLSRQDMEAILAVTRALAAPFDLRTMLAEVTAAACRVLHAERSSVWLHDDSVDEMVLEVASDIAQVRVPVGSGLVGACARERRLINVPDCYGDPRFDASVDRRSGFHTRCSLTLPLVDHQGRFIGVMQVLNQAEGVFDAADETLAEALAAQCAVALSRVRMTEALIEAEKLRQELELARVVQMSTLPATLPRVPGYDMHATFLPASLTGGDTYDLSLIDQGLLVVIGDATGHGIAPALSVTQMHAMLRMALRLGASLEVAFRQVNDQLAETLPPGHFVTAFIGLLDAATNRLRFVSGGQGPILHWRAAEADCVLHKAGSFPMGAMPLASLRPAVQIEFAPGDVLALLTDGIYEYEDAAGSQFGAPRAEAVLRLHGRDSAAELAEQMLRALREFAGGAAQEDDVTMVLLKREPAKKDTAMEIEVSEVIEPDHKITRIRLNGRLDAPGADRIDTQFTAAAVASGRNVMVDLSGVSFVASMGIRLLIASARGLRGKGAQMVLFGAQPLVHAVLDQAALDQIIPMVATEQQALDRLTA